jgi:hypothetical protein
VKVVDQGDRPVEVVGRTFGEDVRQQSGYLLVEAVMGECWPPAMVIMA